LSGILFLGVLFNDALNSKDIIFGEKWMSKYGAMVE
jgi:hypothetical protein